MPIFRLLVGVLTLVLLLPPLAARGADLLEAPRCGQPPRVDGVLDDAAWRQARELEPLRRVLAGGEAATVKTTAWLTRDEGWLYIAFRCEEPNRVGLKRTVTRTDGPVTLDDCVEIFLDPGTGGARYVHLMLSVGGVRADQLCTGAQRDRNWNMPWLGAAKQDVHTDSAVGWSAEVAIPLAALPRGAGDWRLNLCRLRAAATPLEYYSLVDVPATLGFHAPQQFATLAGTAGLSPAMVFCPMVNGARLTALAPVDHGYSYGVEVTLSNRTGLAGSVELLVRDQPHQGAAREFRQKVDLPANGVRQVTVPVTIPSLGPRDASLEVRDAVGTLLLTRSLENMEQLNPFSAFLDRNRYTTEASVQVHAELTYQDQDLQLAASVAGGAEHRAAVRGRHAQVSMPIEQLPEGRHPVQVRLLQGDAVVGVAELQLTKVAPAPAGGNELKIDHYHRALILNGEPWFPVGAFGLHFHGRLEGSKQRMFERQLQNAQAAGLNFYADWVGIGSEGRTVEDARIQYDLAQRYGLKVYALPFGYSQDLYYNNPNFIANALRHISSLDPFLKLCSNHPAVIGYYQFDEPPPGAGIDEALIALADKLHSRNPHHLVYMSLTRTVHESQRNWTGTLTDLLGAHNYWYVEKPRTLVGNADSFHELDEYAQSRRIPTMHAPQLDGWGSGYEGGGFMTIQEQRAQTWLAVIHGARSLMYFVLPLRTVDSRRTQRQLCDQLQQLAPALLQREPEQTVTFEPAGAVSASTHRWPLVHTSLRRFPDGRLLLLALNTSWAAHVQVQYRLSALGEGAVVTSLVEQPGNRPVSAGAFSDDIGPWGTRAYVIENATLDEATPLTLHLTLSGPAVTNPSAEGTANEPANLVANGGFEHNGGWSVSKEFGGETVMRFTAEQPHAGARSLQMIKADTAGSSDVVSEPLTLKPGKHRFTCFIRSQITQGTQHPNLTILSLTPVGGVYAVNAMNGVNPQLPADQWNKVIGHFTVPEGAPQSVRVWLRVPRGTVGQVWFDDVQIEALTAPQPAGAEPAAVKNLVINASFERQRVPHCPSGWQASVWQYLIGEEKGCSAVRDQPVDGEYCYRIVKEDNGYVYAAQATPMKVKPHTTYTLSAYLRAQEPNTPVSVYLPGGPKPLRLGTKWERHTLTFQTGDVTSTSFGFYPDGDCTIWLDAVQLEEGAQATPFQPTP